jgi:enoyl-CoA hydratase
MSTRNNHINVDKNNEVVVITLNKPDGLNILDSKMLHDLGHILAELEKEDDIRALVITGNKNFSAGANIKEMKDFTAVEARTFSELGHRVFNHVEEMGIPVIAAINGYAFGGGCELSLACDIRIAGESAKFGQPEVNLGLIPGFGGTQRLAWLVGKGKAKELVLTGRIIDAREAQAIGLVNAVVKDNELMTKAVDIANVISEKGPIAIKKAKRLMTHEIRENLEREIISFSECFATQDTHEGINAFLEKRKPVFSGT